MSLRRLAGLGPALPALLLLFVFFLFPVVRLLGLSVEGGTFEWYAKALGEGLYLQVFLNTFEIALWVTVICLLLGGVFLWRRSPADIALAGLQFGGAAFAAISRTQCMPSHQSRSAVCGRSCH